MQRRDVADTAVDDETGPAVVAREPGELVADESDSPGAAAVDDEHTARAGLPHALLHQNVVLVAADGRDLARERRNATELSQLELADPCEAGVVVEDIGGGSHRPRIRTEKEPAPAEEAAAPPSACGRLRNSF